MVRIPLHLCERLLEMGDITKEGFPIGVSFVLNEGIQLTDPFQTAYRKILYRLGE